MGRKGKSVNVEGIRRVLQSRVETTGTVESTAAPTPAATAAPGLWGNRLAAAEPHAREEACGAVAHLALAAGNLALFVGDGIHMQLAALAANDDAPAVRAAAMGALRNVLSRADPAVTDAVVAGPADASWSLVAGTVRSAQAAAAALGAAIAAPPVEGEEELAEAPEAAPAAALEEALQLAATLAEGSEVANDALAASPELLTQVIAPALSTPGQPAVYCAAAECLHAMSDDTPAVAQFLASGLSEPQLAALNAAIDAPSQSPTLLRGGLHLAGTLMNCAPTPANAARVLPLLSAALSTPAVAVVSAVLPLLAADSTVANEERTAGVAQAMDRLRCLRTGLDVFANVLSLVCEGHDDDADDEAAFAANPHAAVLLGAGVVAHIVARTAELVAPLPDAVLHTALRVASPSGEVSTLQALFAACEVACFGVAASLVALLPLSHFGVPAALWGGVLAALDARLEYASGEASPCRDAMLLQLESLLELAWGVQRKDEAAATAPSAAQVDVFTKCGWMAGVTAVGRTAAVGVVGCIGKRTQDAALNHSCGNFCCRIVASCAASPDTLEIAAEAADLLMDLYSAEAFDQSAYVPLQVQAGLTQFLPLLRAHVKGLPKGRKGTTLHMLRLHLDEVATNLAGFLQYKAANTAGCA